MPNNQQSSEYITIKNSGFKRFFEAGVSLPELTAGVHDAKLLHYNFVEHPRGDHIRLELQLDDRIIVENLFENRVTTVLNQLKGQLGKADQLMPVKEVFETILNRNIKITISFVEVNYRLRRNVDFSVKTEESIENGDEIPF